LNVDSVQERDQRQERQIDIEAGRACQREKAVALTRPASAAAPDLAYKAAIVRLPRTDARAAGRRPRQTHFNDLRGNPAGRAAGMPVA
jgi:hypothetical protein